MFEVFGLRLATGLVLSLVVLMKGEVEPRFFRLHYILILCLIGASVAFSFQIESEWFWLCIGIAGGMSLLAAWSWSVAELAILRWPTLWSTALSCLAAIGATSSEPAFAANWWLERVVDLSSALLLGSVLTAMLLGHWYLIAPHLSIAPLLSEHRLLFLALLLRWITLGLAILVLTAGTLQLDRLGWIWLSVRVLAGLFGASVLARMSWEAAKIRSTQSATGILYVAVIFVFIGELTDQLLLDHLGESMP